MTKEQQRRSGRRQQRNRQKSAESCSKRRQRRWTIKSSCSCTPECDNSPPPGPISVDASEREEFERGFGTGFGARTSFLNLTYARIITRTHSPNWPASARMGEEESETLASATESWVSSNCGLWEETEEAVFPISGDTFSHLWPWVTFMTYNPVTTLKYSTL